MQWHQHQCKVLHIREALDTAVLTLLEHLREKPQTPDRHWQVSLCLRNAKDENIKSASTVTGVLMLLC